MMQFTFEVPFKFERLFNFDNPWLARNNYWVENDSNPDFIKFNSYKVKKTPVTKLYIAFSPKYNKYEITLSDEFGCKDDFRVSLTEFPNFLKEFGLL